MSDIQLSIVRILKNTPSKPGLLAQKIGISRQALHAHLRTLLREKRIRKEGKGAHVMYYIVSDEKASTRVQKDYDYNRTVLLPKYLKLYANQITLTELELREHILDTPKDTKMSLEFLIDAAAVYSSNIEGNTLDLNSFLNSRMAPAKHRPKEAKEIEDLVSAYEYAKKHAFTEKSVLKAHGILSKEFVSPSRQGKYRKEPVGVYSQQGLEYMAVEAHIVQQEMQELFAVIGALLSKKQSPGECFFWATWIHMMIALIHPFSDGNGRTARLCEKWYLMQALGQHMFALQSEEQYWHQRPKYYAALKLGVNYWETDMSIALPFFVLLPKSL